MKKYVLIISIAFVFLFGGCGSSSKATVEVLETCKVIGSPIIETSISANQEYFTITFENGIFYCEDRTNGSPVYTIKVPNDKEFDMYAILTSIISNLEEKDFKKLETDNEVSFPNGYRNYTYFYKTTEGNTVKYTINY